VPVGLFFSFADKAKICRHTFVWQEFLRQYRTKIVRQMRRQIFRQMKQKAE